MFVVHMISKDTIPQVRAQRKAVQMIAGPVADDWGRWAGVRPVCPFLAAGGRICKKILTNVGHVCQYSLKVMTYFDTKCTPPYFS